MKKLLLICALVVFSAAPAFAQVGGALFLAWDNCLGDAGATTISTFDCVNGVGGSMYINYQLNSAAANVVAFSGIMDVNINLQGSVPAFWHFESGGCNDGYLVVTSKRTSPKCSTSQTTLCATTGAQCSDFITAYGIGAPAKLPPNRARILISLARAASSPVTLVAAPTKQYGYQLDIDASNATEVGGACDGCVSIVSIALNAIVLESAVADANGEAVTAIITSDMAGSSPGVCINEAICNSVPVRNATWGQLKALYR